MRTDHPIIVLVLLTSLGFEAGGLCAQEQRVRVQAAAEPSVVHVGEPIRYVITVEHPAGLSVTMPRLDSTIGEWSVEEAPASASTRTSHDTVFERRTYRLASFVTGTHTLPAPTVTYHGPDGREQAAHGPPVTVTIRSLLLGQELLEDIKPIKPPVARVPLWAWIAGAVMLAGGVAGWWWMRRTRQQPHAASPAPAAHEVALEALEQLRREQLPLQGRYEEHYVRLSTIVRVYIEHRFGLRAPEMTTEEFLQAASNGQALSESHRRALQEFLMRCDLVKFARYRPSGQEAEEAWCAAQRFVHDTRPLSLVQEVS